MNKTNAAVDAAVAIANLRFSYGESTVIDIESIDIARGQKVFLHGPSGSGKTTLLGILAGILRPQSGTVKILGQDISELSGAALDRFRGENIGYIFQMFNLLPYLSVKENILLGCQLNQSRRKRCEDKYSSLEKGGEYIARQLRLDPYLNKAVHRLSVGQQQRVAAARALMGSPSIIIADEPTSALDHDHRELFLELLFHEAASFGATVVFVSHDRTLERLFDATISLPQLNRVAIKQGEF